MFIELIILSLIIGLVRGGKISRFKNINFKKMWLFIIAILIQYFLFSINHIEEVHLFDNLFKYLKQLIIISYILLFIGIIINLRYKSLWLILAGSILNFIVLLANGWKRPVLEEGLKLVGIDTLLPLYIPILEETKLSILGDIIIVSKPYPFPHVFSIGDIIISLGLFMLIQEIMLSDRGNTNLKYFGRNY